MRRVFRENKRRKAQGPDSVSPTCFKTCADQLAPILNRFFNVLQQITGAVQSPLMFQMLDHHPRPKETQNYWTQWLQTCGSNMLLMKWFERLVLAYLKASTGPLLDPLQLAYRANRSVDDAVNMGLHFILQHLDRPGTYVRILFVDFSSAFNTISSPSPLPSINGSQASWQTGSR